MAKLTERQELLAKMAAIIFAVSAGGNLSSSTPPGIAVEKAKEILAAVEK